MSVQNVQWTKHKSKEEERLLWGLSEVDRCPLEMSLPSGDKSRETRFPGLTLGFMNTFP